MKSAQKQYTNEMKRKFGYYATWNPGVPLQLGDIGTFKKNVFTRLSNIMDEGINFDTREDNTKTPLEHNSQGSVSVTTKLSGTIAPIGSVLTNMDAGIIVEFSKENATLFKANNTTSPSIKDAIKLGDEILKRYNDGKWEKDHVIITELIVAESATVIISNGANGKIELKANADIGVPSLDIANADLKLTPQFSRGLETKIVCAEGLTPLFKVMGIKTGIFKQPSFETSDSVDSDSENPGSAKDEFTEEISFGYISDKDAE